MFTLCKLLVLFLVLLPSAAMAIRLGVLAEESDGSPSGYVYKLKVTNGSLSIADSVGTLATGAGSVTAWDDITAPDANDEIDFAAYVTEMNVEDFRIGDGGSNYAKFTGSAITLEGTFDIEGVTATEFGYLDMTSSAQTQLNAKEGTLTNSAGLLAALSDETGTGVAVFGTSPTFTTGITIGTDTLTEAIAGYLVTVTSDLQAQLDARALESVVGTSLEADDLELSGSTLRTAAEIPHVDVAEALSGNWEIQDSVNFSFGNDDDLSMAWETADAPTTIANSFMWFDASNNPKMWFIPASNSLNVPATTAPEIGVYDSDSATNDTNLVDIRADQYAGGFGADFTTTTEDAEISDIFTYSVIGGTKSLIAHWDGSDEAWIFGDSVTGEDLKIDFETATDNEIGISTDEGSTTDLNLGTLDVQTTGTLQGAVPTVTDADGFTMSTIQGYGTVVYATGAGTIVMPATAAGMQFSVECHAAAAVVLNPDATGTEDTIRLDGAVLAQGDSITSASAAGDICVCTYYAADTWSCITNGWTDTN